MKKNKKMFDFIGNAKKFFTITIVLIVATIITAFFGVNVAIEFKGGTILSYTYDGNINTDSAYSALEDIVGNNINIQQGENVQTGSQNITISFGSDDGLTVQKQSQITDKLQEIYPDNNITLLDSNDVSPTAGKDFLIKSIVAVLFAVLLIIIYVAIRFRKIGGWSAGVCSTLALIHDTFFVFAAFVFCRFDLDSNFIAVILTILGYSVNDTIVIYDRIRENSQLMPKKPLAEIVNLSLNQTVARSLRTAGMAMIAVAVITIVAVINSIESILSFSVPLLIGMFFGSYSSLCLAPQIWVWWKSRQHKKESGAEPRTAKN